MSDTKTFFDVLEATENDYKKELHLPTGDPSRPDDTANKLHSPFYSTTQKATWYYKPIDPIESLQTKESIKYIIPGAPSHGLSYLYITQNFPPVKALEGFEVCWSPYPVVNQIQKIEVLFNKTILQTLDNAYLNCYLRSMTKNLDSKSLQIDLGNSAELRKWNSMLPSQATEYILPLSFSENFSQFFPLYLCGEADTLEIAITYQLNVAKLLKVRVADTKEIVPMTKDNVKVSGFPPDLKGNVILDSPKMFGSFLYQTGFEVDYNRCHRENRDIIHIDNTYCLDSEKRHKMGDIVTIDFKNLLYPVHTAYWMCENQSDISHYGNCTTEAGNEEDGESPIKHVTLSHPKGNIFKDMGQFNSHIRQHFRNVPSDKGYGAWSTGVIASDINPKPEIDISQGTITFQLKNDREANRFADIVPDKQCKDEFKLKVRLVYTRIGKFTKVVTSEDTRDRERAVFKFLDINTKG